MENLQISEEFDTFESQYDRRSEVTTHKASSEEKNWVQEKIITVENDFLTLLENLKGLKTAKALSSVARQENFEAYKKEAFTVSDCNKLQEELFALQNDLKELEEVYENTKISVLHPEAGLRKGVTARKIIFVEKQISSLKQELKNKAAFRKPFSAYNDEEIREELINVNLLLEKNFHGLEYINFWNKLISE